MKIRTHLVALLFTTETLNFLKFLYGRRKSLKIPFLNNDKKIKKAIKPNKTIFYIQFTPVNSESGFCLVKSRPLRI